ncbi:MAG: DUF192 domain-containing protein [Pseudomonadota bacterium]
MKTVLTKGGVVLYESCRVANNFFSRFLGLMGKAQVLENEAIVFPKCNSIHTFFMRVPIDVIFVSETGKVVKVFSGLVPWRLLLPMKGVAHTIEIASLGADRKNIKPGDQLSCPGVFE